jgi:AraC-like DNA-binding protein
MSNHSFAPLLEVLRIIKFWLERDGASRVMVATPTIAAFRRQELADHIKVTVKKRHGKRVSVRGPRNFRLTRLVQARWPEDGQLEAAVPSLVCVIKGQADFHFADYMVQCQPGDWIFIPAGVSKPDASLPYVLDDSDRECDLLWIYPGPLNGVGLECFICHSDSKRMYSGVKYGTSDVKNDFLVQLFNELNGQMQNSRKEELIQHLLTGITLWLLWEIEEGRAVIPWTRRLDQPVERSPDFITEACKHIESHLDHHLTIPEMARLMAVSPATFTRRFRADMGQSFNEYLTVVRLKGAETLLLDTTMTVNEVASHTGVTYERLRDLFQRHYGCSPGEFRKRGN